MREWIMKYWLEAIFGVVVTGLGVACKKLAKRIKQQSCDQKALRNGTQALLRNEIIREYEKYKDRTWIPIYGRENVLEMYNAYHELGGNGAITQLMDELKELPSSPKSVSL